jgi:hypothetical protein
MEHTRTATNWEPLLSAVAGEPPTSGLESSRGRCLLLCGIEDLVMTDAVDGHERRQDFANVLEAAKDDDVSN